MEHGEAILKRIHLYQHRSASYGRMGVLGDNELI